MPNSVGPVLNMGVGVPGGANSGRFGESLQ